MPKVQIVNKLPEQPNEETCYLRLSHRIYAGEVYSILANPQRLSLEEIYNAAFSKGFFGYRREGSGIAVYTD